MLVFIPIQSVCLQIVSVSVTSSNGSLLGLLVLVRRDHFYLSEGELEMFGMGMRQMHNQVTLNFSETEKKSRSSLNRF